MAGEPSQSPEVKFYLSCFPAPPLVLDRDKPTTIGRADDSTILLADATVSRLHAIVEWKNDNFILRDPGSRNGILLNGKRVEEAPLKNDDKISIGERVFTFITGEEREVTREFMRKRRKRQSGGTEILKASALARSAGNLAGNMKDFALVELLQALDLGRKTGCVTVVCEDLRGEMLLREGSVVSCTLGGIKGEDAAYAMLSLGDGTFDFEARPVEVEDGLTASTASLLMESLRRIDEERRAQSEAAAAADADAAEVDAPEPRDPSLDTKHGEPPPPEVEAASDERPALTGETKPSVEETQTMSILPDDADNPDDDSEDLPNPDDDDAAEASA
jgi:hypothetical protein